MNAVLTYKEIPQEERKRLVAEAYRQEPALRTLQFMALLTAMMFSSDITTGILARIGSESVLLRLGVHVLVAVAISATIWELFGRPRLKAKVLSIKYSRPHDGITLVQETREKST